MERKQFLRMSMILGIVIFSFGLGWFVGLKVGEIYIPLWRALLIFIGFLLILFSFYPTKKKRKKIKSK